MRRVVALTATSVALTIVGSTLPAHADADATPSVGQSADALDRHGNLKAETVDPGAAPLALSQDRSKAVVLSPRSSNQISIGLPDAADRADGEAADGVNVFRSETDGTSVVVNPTATGVQLAVVIGSADSPSRYTYPVSGPNGSTVVLDDEGGAGIVDKNGDPLASVDAPWARDANGKKVPTRFVLTGPNQLTQVVDHAAGNYAYPVTADPKVFSCDAYTSTCVKFSKSETKTIANGIAGKSAAAGALYLCSKIPNIAAGAVCVVAVTAYSLALGKSFKSAASAGKCIELHFLTVPVFTLTRWKTEGC